MGSDRNFGLVFAALFLVVALLPLYRGGPIRWWSVALGACFLISALFAPWSLRPLNFLWYKLGLLLHHVVNPIVMAVLYFGAVVPMGLLLRALKKDLLHLRFDKTAESYWIRRESPAPPPGGMSKQF